MALSNPTARDIGFFDPSLRPIRAEHEVVYTDVYDFIDRIRVCVQQWSENQVVPLLPECLRGDALEWYSKQTTKDTKTLLERLGSSALWSERLVLRFRKESPSRSPPTTRQEAEIRTELLARRKANINRLQHHSAKPSKEPLYQTSYEFKTPFYGSNDPSPARVPLSAIKPAESTSETSIQSIAKQIVQSIIQPGNKEAPQVTQPVVQSVEKKDPKAIT